MKHKTLLATTVLLVGLLAVTVPAKADGFGIQVGATDWNASVRLSYGSRARKAKRDVVEPRRDSRREHRAKQLPALQRVVTTCVDGRSFRQRWSHGAPRRRDVHTCHHLPVFRKVWVEPVYTSVYDGLDACGRPRYRSVLVVPGYYRNVVSHYACKCGVRKPRRHH